MIYDAKANIWTSKPNDLSFGSVHQGQLIYFEKLGAAGVLVLLGGSLGPNLNKPVSIHLILLISTGNSHHTTDLHGHH